MEQLFDFRKGRPRGSALPEGKCIYIQAGDTSDFDGYFIAAASCVVQQKTKDFEVVIAVPERRVWDDPNERDLLKHDRELSDQQMDTAGALLRYLCPQATLLRGLLNKRNLIPWRWAFNEAAKYGPLLRSLPKVYVGWAQLTELKDRILSDVVHSVLLDVNGSLGYLEGLLLRLGPEGRRVLGSKMKASGLPVVVMAGVQAELKTATMPLPGRDPRSTMNANYSPDAVRCLLALAREQELPLLFVTNNICNSLLRFATAGEVVAAFGLQGLLKGIAHVWYGAPHLQGKCVPFDWVSFCAMLLYGRQQQRPPPQQQQQQQQGGAGGDSRKRRKREEGGDEGGEGDGEKQQQELGEGEEEEEAEGQAEGQAEVAGSPPALRTARQQLYVDESNPAVMVLRDPSVQPGSEDDELAQTLAANLAGTALWGEVESVVGVDREVMLRLARYAAETSAGNRFPDC